MAGQEVLNDGAAMAYEEKGQRIVSWRQETRNVGGHIGSVYLIGVLENTTSELLDTVYIYFNLYDDRSVRIDRCWAKLEAVQPGEKCEFKASYSPELMQRVARTEIAGIQIIDEKDEKS